MSVSDQVHMENASHTFRQSKLTNPSYIQKSRKKRQGDEKAHADCTMCAGSELSGAYKYSEFIEL